MAIQPVQHASKLKRFAVCYALKHSEHSKYVGILANYFNGITMV